MSTFSTRTLILGHQKAVSHFLNQILNVFHIKRANDTFVSIWIVSSAKFFKTILRLFSKLTYSFVAIDFWCFPKIQNSIFTSQKSS